MAVDQMSKWRFIYMVCVKMLTTCSILPDGLLSLCVALKLVLFIYI